ncbi:MAG TPA: hypothetical protein VMZ31_12395 [Phycisphaerae bacterium]|nr:hypothetical protein [Phycisphaerae bacterium]
MDPFARVIASPSPWTYETAIATGFAVSDRYTPVPFTETEWEELGQLMPPGTPFIVRSETMQRVGLAERLGNALRNQWTDYAAAVPHDECCLVVTHSGYIDNSAVACLPAERHAQWGENFGHCEGIRLAFDDGHFVSGKIIRVR